MESELICDDLKFKRDINKKEWYCHNISIICIKDNSVVLLPITSFGKNINTKPTSTDYCVYSIEFTVHDETIFHVRIPDYSLFMNEDIDRKARKLKDLYKEYVINGEITPKEFNNKILENIEW